MVGGKTFRTSHWGTEQMVALLDSGKIIALGTVEELKQSDNEKVQQFFNRVPDPEKIDRESYLNSLIG